MTKCGFQPREQPFRSDADKDQRPAALCSTMPQKWSTSKRGKDARHLFAEEESAALCAAPPMGSSVGSHLRGSKGPVFTHTIPRRPRSSRYQRTLQGRGEGPGGARLSCLLLVLTGWDGLQVLGFEDLTALQTLNVVDAVASGNHFGARVLANAFHTNRVIPYSIRTAGLVKCPQGRRVMPQSPGGIGPLVG